MSRDIFVFGSNLNGDHYSGSAHEAFINHGAKMGQGVGLQGNSYAIPTLDRNMSVLPIHRIKCFIDEFLKFTAEHPNWLFKIVTIGCGVAGYYPKQIAPLFRNAPDNCLLPPEFSYVLEKEKV